MHPYEISVLDESYLLFSLPCGANVSEYARVGERSVFLLPSVNADFRIMGFGKGGKPLYDYYSAAVCAAAYLAVKCGLPLAEINLETPNGNLEILCTGSDSFSVKINKCKLLFSNHIEICGCIPDVAEVETGGMFRVASVPFCAKFSEALAPRLAGAAFPLPQAVILSTLRDNELFIKAYADYNPIPPSTILCYAAAAYKEGRGATRLSLGNGAAATVGFSSVEISLKPVLSD